MSPAGPVRPAAPMPGWVAALRSTADNRVGLAIQQLHAAENELAEELLTLADRHKTDHEVFHVARDVARWSQQHVRELAGAGSSYGVELDPEPEDEAGLLGRLRQKGAELVGRQHVPSLLLLADLRRVHTMAAGNSLDWEVLAQTAQAMKDTELLGLASRCHPQTLRQMRWANAKLKESAAQTMVTG